MVDENSVERVYLGYAEVISDGTESGTSVKVILDKQHIVYPIEGPTTVRFYIKYLFYYPGDSLAVVGANFNVLNFHVKITPGPYVNLDGYIHDSDEKETKEVEVQVGDFFLFEIHAFYVSVYPIFEKHDLKNGDGIFNKTKPGNLKPLGDKITINFVEKTNNQMGYPKTILLEKLISYIQILSSRPILSKLLIKDTV